MSVTNRVLIPNVLNITANTKKIHYFSFAEDFSEELFNKNGKLKVEFYIKPQKYFKEFEKRDYLFYYSDEIKVYNNENNIISLFWKKRIYPIGNLYANCVIHPNKILLEVNKFYYNIIKFKIENLLPPGIILKDLTYLLLILNNYLPVHSSSFAINEKEAFLILAPPNVGKSYTVMQAIKDGFYFLSEDISIVDKNGNIYPIVYTSTYMHEVSKLKYFSLLSYYLPQKVKPMGKKYKNKLLGHSEIKKIFFLEHSREKKIEYFKKAFTYFMNKEEIITKILTLNRDEFKIFNNKIILSYFYLTNLIFKFNSLELELIDNLVENAEDIILIKSPVPKYFYKIIKKLI